MSGSTRLTPTTVSPTTTSIAPLPGRGFVADHVSAVGDSVMIDAQPDLQADVPGITIDAAVSRQWSDGEALLQQLKTDDQLGAFVVVALGTNGPITNSDFDNMMSILAGAIRVVFVNIHVDQPWQDPNNAVLAAGVAQHANTVLADWASLAAMNPQWFYSDGAHMPIGGAGAHAYGAMVAGDIWAGDI